MRKLMQYKHMDYRDEKRWGRKVYHYPGICYRWNKHSTTGLSDQKWESHSSKYHHFKQVSK